MNKCFILLLLLSVNFKVYSQNVKDDGEVAKAILLFYVSNLIEWPVSDTVESFNIGVQSTETAFFNKLSELAINYTVQNRPIIIKKLDEFEDPQNIDVIFVDKSYHKDIDQILKYCQSHQILQVTDRLENKQFTVVNFIKDSKTNDFGYEVNKANLVATELRYQDELLLYGGTLSDLRDLYSTTKELLENETEKVIELSEQIIEKSNELNQKNASIADLTVQISDKKDTLVNLLGTIKNQNQILQEQSSTYEETKSDLLQMQHEYTNQLASIRDKERKVKLLDSAIHEREKTIHTQSNTIRLKNLTIEAKNKTLWILTFFGSTIFLLGVLIFRAYFMKKRNARLLELKVEERTGELLKMNSELQDEMERRMRSEEELSKSERNYREIFNATTDAICIFSIEGNILDVNNAMLSMYGYQKAEVSSLLFSNLCFKDDKSANDIALTYLNKAIRLGRTEFDSKARRKNGDIFWVEVALLQTNIAGSDCILSVIRDIDEKKKNSIELEAYRLKLEQMVEDRTIELKKANIELNATNEKLKKLNRELESQKQELNTILQQLRNAQEQLVDSEKMAAIGTMAAGVAHEINNPLNYIRGGVFGIKTILGDKFKDNYEISQLMDGIDLGVDKAAKIVSSLNHFSRQSEVYTEDCNIHTIIENCLAILQNAVKFRIEIKKEFISKTLICQGNEGKLHQVLLNVLTNATQAIENEGTIMIATGELTDENKLYIKITDTGCGIKPENLDKVTTPFFTTKEVGKGTGLGLSISKKIISDHRGKLIINSEVNKGTTVIIHLPFLQHVS